MKLQRYLFKDVDGVHDGYYKASEAEAEIVLLQKEIKRLDSLSDSYRDNCESAEAEINRQQFTIESLVKRVKELEEDLSKTIAENLKHCSDYIEMAGMKLKPCPFCGDKDKDAIEIVEYCIEEYWKIGCINVYCVAQPSVTGETREEAIKAWNRRSK